MQGAACSCRWECCGVRRRRVQLFTASTGQPVRRLAGFGKYWSWTRGGGPSSSAPFVAKASMGPSFPAVELETPSTGMAYIPN